MDIETLFHSKKFTRIVVFMGLYTIFIVVNDGEWLIITGGFIEVSLEKWGYHGYIPSGKLTWLLKMAIFP